MITLGMTVAFLIVIVLGMPIGIAMLVVAAGVMVIAINVPIALIPQLMVSSYTKFELLSVPLFILAAEIMNSGGLTNRIFKLANLFVGWMTGSLAQVNIIGSVIFAGINGAAIADAAGLGRVEFKSMTEAGYRPSFSAAVTLASCLIGPLIPPSIVLIIYAVEAQVSVGRMLLAGVVPGLLMAVILMVFVYWLASTGREHCPKTPVPRGKDAWRVLWDGLPAAIAPLIIVIGLVGGVFTVTETGAIACVYAFVLSAILYRELSWNDFVLLLERSVLASAMVMFMIATATAMSWVITWEQSVKDLAIWFSELPTGAWVKLALLIIFLLIIGLALEGVPALLIITPILLPTIQEIGLDPVQFGVVMAVALGIGLLTPPVGLGLFVVSAYTDLTVEELSIAVLPFLIPLTLVLILITYVPAFTLWLPNLLLP